MTNHEYINQLPPEDFAKIIINTDESYYTTLYISPSGNKYYDEEDAIEDTVKWLGQKVKDNMKRDIL